jgi:hypothetical protein
LAENLGFGLGGVHEKNMDVGSTSAFAVGPGKNTETLNLFIQWVTGPYRCTLTYSQQAGVQMPEH